MFEMKHILALSEESLPPASVKRTVFMPTGIAQIITGSARSIPLTPRKYRKVAQRVAIKISLIEEIR